MPYGHMPEDDGAECGAADADGYVRERIQTNGRCEVANGRGDTYGPISYLAYVPGFLAMGYDFKWDFLPAAHFTSLLWDSLALIGLGALGFRFGGASARGDPGVRVGGLPVHAVRLELELERRDHARAS